MRVHRHRFFLHFAQVRAVASTAADSTIFLKPALIGLVASALSLYIVIHFYTFVKGGFT